MHVRTLISLLAVLALCACAISHLQPLSIPLAYNSANLRNLGSVGTLSCVSLARVQVDDARTVKTLGVRTLEGKPDSADVTASSDVVSWAHDGLQNALTLNGFSVSGQGPQLQVSLDSVRTTENAYHRSSYDARIALTARLQSSTGKSCWQGTVQGTARNYGFAGSTENYQELLNSALDDANTQLIQSAGFKDALCKCAD
jgi:hypothetical protein